VCLDLVDRRLYLGICQDVSGEEDVVIAAWIIQGSGSRK
jgi:hypothetical protein